MPTGAEGEQEFDERELRIIKLAALGWTNGSIAAHIHLSPPLVSQAVASAQRKLGADRQGLALYVVDHILTATEREKWRVRAELRRAGLYASGVATPRHRELGMYLAANPSASNGDLAARFGISQSTVRGHLADLWNNLGPRSGRVKLVVVLHLAPLELDAPDAAAEEL